MALAKYRSLGPEAAVEPGMRVRVSAPAGRAYRTHLPAGETVGQLMRLLGSAPVATSAEAAPNIGFLVASKDITLRSPGGGTFQLAYQPLIGSPRPTWNTRGPARDPAPCPP